MSTNPPPRPRTTIKVASGDLRLNIEEWNNPRSFTGLSPDEIDDMAASLKAHGMYEKPKAVQVRDLDKPGVFVLIIDGQRRVLGDIKAHGAKHVIDVELLREEVIDKFTPEIGAELLLDALRIGSQRKGLTGYELSENADRLRKAGHKLKEIGEAIDRDESWVSKMLKARANASPELMIQWRKGDITDEQFRDLAEAPRDAQPEAAKATAEAAKRGDRAGARTAAKETAIKAREARKAAKPPKPAKAAKPPKETKQREMFGDRKGEPAPAPAPAPAKKITPPGKAMLEESVALRAARPPTHDLVKGILLGFEIVLGRISFEDLPKPWAQYLSRAGGTAKTKPAKVPKKGKAAKKGKRRAR